MKIIKNKNVEELMKTTATFIIDEMEELAKTQKKISIGLVGGTSVSKLYSELATRKSKAWEKCHFFIIDERYVPIDNKESNFKFAKETLLEPLLKKNLIQDEFIHPMRTELKGIQTAKDYSKQFETYAAPIDIAILSSGEDGHVAGIFPEKEYSDDIAYEYFEDSPKLPPKRISITPGALAMTKTAFTLFIGEGKKEALKKYLNSEYTRTQPQSVLDSIHNNIIITDLVNVK